MFLRKTFFTWKLFYVTFFNVKSVLRLKKKNYVKKTLSQDFRLESLGNESANDRRGAGTHVLQLVILDCDVDLLQF